MGMCLCVCCIGVSEHMYNICYIGIGRRHCRIIKNIITILFISFEHNIGARRTYDTQFPRCLDLYKIIFANKTINVYNM